MFRKISGQLAGKLAFQSTLAAWEKKLWETGGEASREAYRWFNILHVGKKPVLTGLARGLDSRGPLLAGKQ